jgi:hypothetical protein
VLSDDADVEKRRRADLIVDSGASFDHARAQMHDIVVLAAILVHVLCAAVIAPLQAADSATRLPASSPPAESVCTDITSGKECRMQKSAGAPTLSWIPRNRSTIAARNCATFRNRRI